MPPAYPAIRSGPFVGGHERYRSGADGAVSQAFGGSPAGPDYRLSASSSASQQATRLGPKDTIDNNRFTPVFGVKWCSSTQDGIRRWL